MSRNEHLSPPTLPPPVGYSHVVKTNGPLAYIAGQVPCDADGNVVGEGDFARQLEQVFANLAAAVAAAGASMHDIVKLTYYCADSVDPQTFSAVRAVRDRYVDTSRPPASTFIVVRRLVRAAWLIEIDAVVAL